MLGLLSWDCSDCTDAPEGHVCWYESRDGDAHLNHVEHEAPREGLPSNLAWWSNNATLWQHTKVDPPLATKERRNASNGAAYKARCGPLSSRPGPPGRLGHYRGVKCRASAAAWWSITRRMAAFIVYTLITAVSSSRPFSL
jgi:hypothetical protein